MCDRGERFTFTWYGFIASSRACVMWSWCVCLRPPRCVSTGPVVVSLAEMANERERAISASYYVAHAELLG